MRPCGRSLRLRPRLQQRRPAVDRIDPGWLTFPSTVTFCDTDDATDSDTGGLTRYFAPSFVAISLDSAAAVMPSARTVPISGSDTLPEASTCNSSKLRSSSRSEERRVGND